MRADAQPLEITTRPGGSEPRGALTLPARPLSEGGQNPPVPADIEEAGERGGVTFARLYALNGPISAPARKDLRGRAVVSDRTFALAQVKQLWKRLCGGCQTGIGAESLYRSLHHPPTELPIIAARQSAVRELAANKKVQECVAGVVKAAGVVEQALAAVPDSLAEHRAVARALGDLSKVLRTLPRTNDPLLASLFDELRTFPECKALRLYQGAVCLVRDEPVPVRDAPRLYDRIFNRLVPGPIGVKTATLTAGSIALGSIGVTLGQPSAILAPVWGATLLLEAMKSKRAYDKNHFFGPIRHQLFADPTFKRCWTALGLLDELRGLASLTSRFTEGGTFPRLRDEARHCFRATHLHNPSLALSGKLSVANDFKVDGEKVIGLTGPNSGGKSTAAITLVQTQLLGQIGGPVPAADCELSPADQLHYQAQDFNALEDAEGRFGTELATTRDVFFGATPATLAVFDELAQGTTHEESRTVAEYIAKGFWRKKASVVLITHDHELVADLSGQGVIEPLQVEFREDIPTHRLVPGISITSHALRVARKLGFGPEDVERHLAAGSALAM